MPIERYGRSEPARASADAFSRRDSGRARLRPGRLGCQPLDRLRSGEEKALRIIDANAPELIEH